MFGWDRFHHDSASLSMNRQTPDWYKGPRMRHRNLTVSALPAVQAICVQSVIRFACLVLLVGVTGGCFEKTYTDRMQKTIKFYEHKDKLNRNLGPEWSGSGYKLRVPLGFEIILPPEPKQPDPNDPQPPMDQKTKVEELNDPRQPEFLNFRLPGLIAAWQKDVNVDEAGKSVVKKARFYLLSNGPLFGIAPDVPGRIDPAELHQQVSHKLAENLIDNMQTMTPIVIKAEDWREEKYPAGGFDLVPQVAYQSIILSPKNLFEETAMTFKLYLHGTGTTKTVLLLIYPTETSSSEKLAERFDYSFETLKVPSDPQQAASPGGAAPTGGPSL